MKTSVELAQEQNHLASVWMKRGIKLLEENSPASLREALTCFDQAIAMRNVLPFEADVFFRYGLTAGWMNRGDALTRLGSSDELAEAVRSYDEALSHARLLPLDENPLFRKRFAIAWLNRGITLQQQKKDFGGAVRSFEESIALLEHDNARAIPEQKQLLGCAWMNRGNVLLELTVPNSSAALESARKSLLCLGEIERLDPISAEAGLKARLVQCRAIANLISEPGSKTVAVGDLVAEATDAVDAGLKLSRAWEIRGTKQFRSLAQDLFRFGVRVYQIYQPQFLAEFVIESLDPRQSPGANLNSETHVEALRALWQALRQMQKEGFNPLNSQHAEKFRQRLAEFASAEKRLNELRE